MDVLTYQMPFGKYVGEYVERIPGPYLAWAVKKMNPRTRDARQMKAAAAIELKRRGVYDKLVSA